MHEEALTKEGAVIFPRLAKFEEFYLVGGTALSLHIGHRISVDFVMFSYAELPSNILQKVKRVFSGSSVVVTYRSAEQLNLVVDGVQMTFLQYPYPVVDPLVVHQGVSVASIREIAAMKAFSLGKRLSHKDYVDWYFMLNEHHISLREIVEFAQKKFGGDFNDRLFLGQLTLFEDVPEQQIEFLRDPVERNTIEEFLREASRSYVG